MYTILENSSIVLSANNYIYNSYTSSAAFNVYENQILSVSLILLINYFYTYRGSINLNQNATAIVKNTKLDYCLINAIDNASLTLNNVSNGILIHCSDQAYLFLENDLSELSTIYVQDNCSVYANNANINAIYTSSNYIGSIYINGGSVNSILGRDTLGNIINLNNTYISRAATHGYTTLNILNYTICSTLTISNQKTIIKDYSSVLSINIDGQNEYKINVQLLNNVSAKSAALNQCFLTIYSNTIVLNLTGLNSSDGAYCKILNTGTVSSISLKNKLQTLINSGYVYNLSTASSYVGGTIKIYNNGIINKLVLGYNYNYNFGSRQYEYYHTLLLKLRGSVLNASFFEKFGRFVTTIGGNTYTYINGSNISEQNKFYISNNKGMNLPIYLYGNITVSTNGQAENTHIYNLGSLNVIDSGYISNTEIFDGGVLYLKNGNATDISIHENGTCFITENINANSINCNGSIIIKNNCNVSNIELNSVGKLFTSVFKDTKQNIICNEFSIINNSAVDLPINNGAQVTILLGGLIYNPTISGLLYLLDTGIMQNGSNAGTIITKNNINISNITNNGLMVVSEATIDKIILLSEGIMYISDNNNITNILMSGRCNSFIYNKLGLI